jgi:SAM-dependent methyltransferase
VVGEERPWAARDEGDPVIASVRAYSRHAAEYETSHAAKMLHQVERFAGSLPVPSLILDAGCGPGRDLARFATMGHVVRGVEFNPDFAAMAARSAPTSCSDLREVESLYPDAFFDGIWACASLVHLPRTDALDVLRQFAAILRPGGKLYACVNTTGDTGWLDEADGRRWYCIWETEAFERAVETSGFSVDDTIQGPFVEVWATRTTVAQRGARTASRAR